MEGLGLHFENCWKLQKIASSVHTPWTPKRTCRQFYRWGREIFNFSIDFYTSLSRGKIRENVFRSIDEVQLIWPARNAASQSEHNIPRPILSRKFKIKFSRRRVVKRVRIVHFFNKNKILSPLLTVVFTRISRFPDNTFGGKFKAIKRFFFTFYQNRVGIFVYYAHAYKVPPNIV